MADVDQPLEEDSMLLDKKKKVSTRKTLFHQAVHMIMNGQT